MRLVPTGRLPDALSSIRPQSFDRNFPAEEVLFHPLESSRVIPELATFPSKPTFQSLSDQTTRSFGVFQVWVCVFDQQEFGWSNSIGGRGSSSARPGPAMATADGDICVGQTVELRGKRRGACPKKSMSQQSLGKHSKSEWNGSAAASSTRPSHAPRIMKARVSTFSP